MNAETLAQADRAHDATHKAHDSGSQLDLQQAIAESLRLTHLLREELECRLTPSTKHATG